MSMILSSTGRKSAGDSGCRCCAGWGGNPTEVKKQRRMLKRRDRANWKSEFRL